MQPLSKYLIKCPTCSEYLVKKDLISGNTFGSKLYSDGVRVSPMLPDLPQISICEKCSSYFWVEDADIVSSIKDINDKEFQDQGIQMIRFLSIDELFASLESEIASNDTQETAIRLMIWRSYNDRVREGKAIFNSETDEARWYDNLKELIKRVFRNPEVQSNEELLLMSELARNNSRYLGAIKYLERIIDPKFENIKLQMLEACKNENKYVIEINE